MSMCNANCERKAQIKSSDSKQFQYHSFLLEVWKGTTDVDSSPAGGSYAELFTQKAVDVFVSHWWGHEFSEFVKALEHAVS